MSQWLQVFKNRKKRPEDSRWACKGCGSIVDQSHSETPRNGQCKCPSCVSAKTSSDEYKENFDLIDWTGFESKGVVEGIGSGKKRYRFQ